MNLDKEILKTLAIENRLRMPSKMLAFKDEKKRYKFAWGGRAGGKSLSISKILLNRTSKERIRILCTREIQLSIKDSVHSELKDLIDELQYEHFEVTQNNILHTKTGSEFIFVGMYGQDRKQSIKSYANIDIAWVEEAQAVSKGSLSILIPTIRKPRSEIWFSYNPLLPDDPVESLRNRIPENSKIEVNINHDDNPYLSDEMIEEVRLSKENYDKGIDDSYLHTWLGQPVSLSDRSVFKQKEIIDSVNRKISDEGAIQIGADISRYGNDRTVFFKRKGLKIIDCKMSEGMSTVDTAKYLMDFADHNKEIRIKVDDTGIGGAITDQLKDQKYSVIPVNNGQQAKDPDKYNNAISEQWFYLKTIINNISIPDIQDLKSELMMREWKLDNKGRRIIESKEEYKKRGFRSPDYADALLLCFYEPAITKFQWDVI